MHFSSLPKAVFKAEQRPSLEGISTATGCMAELGGIRFLAFAGREIDMEAGRKTGNVGWSRVVGLGGSPADVKLVRLFEDR